MKPEDVPQELIELAYRHYSMHGQGLVANILAAVLPAHEAMVRAKIAEELRADATVYADLAQRSPKHADAYTARAKALGTAADRITRRLITPTGPPRDPHATGLIDDDVRGGQA